MIWKFKLRSWLQVVVTVRGRAIVVGWASLSVYYSSYWVLSACLPDLPFFTMQYWRPCLFSQRVRGIPVRTTWGPCQYLCSEVIKLAEPPSGCSSDCLRFQRYQSRGSHQGRKTQTGGGGTVCVPGSHSEGQCGPPVWWGGRDSDLQTTVYLAGWVLSAQSSLFLLPGSFISWTERRVLATLRKPSSPHPTFRCSRWQIKLGKNVEKFQLKILFSNHFQQASG